MNLEKKMSAYSIQQVANRTSLPTHTLRYYEKEGLLPNINRSAGGSRRFSEDDLEALELICCLKSTGMSIKQIKQFVALSAQGGQTLKQRCDILFEHKLTVEEQIREMEKHLSKVICKIECFSAQYEEYQKQQA